MLSIVCFVYLQQPKDPNAILPERITPKPDYKVKSKPSSENDVYAKYITGDRGPEFYNEHEFFMKAKGDMQKHHHERVASVSRGYGLQGCTQGKFHTRQTGEQL